MIDIENYCVCKQRPMDVESDAKELIKELKEYRDGMVARNLPFQWISDIITKWEMKKVKTTSEQLQNELEPIDET
jgi:sugar-specific transcriptional regulator TrmB